MDVPENANTDPNVSFDKELGYVWDDGEERFYYVDGGWSKNRKRGRDDNDDNDNEDTNEKTDERRKKKKARPNSAIYISQLPLDTNEKEIEEIFGRYGVISEDLHTGDKKIKLYRDEDGNLKGDALVVYFKPESVHLAIQTMNEQELRFGKVRDGAIRVQEADSTYSTNKPKEQKDPLTKAQKNELKKSLNRLNNKISKWDDDEDPEDSKKPRNAKVVVLKHMFTLQELEDDVTAELDIKEDVRDECETIGPVTSVALYNLEEDGIMTVKFADPEDAVKCVDKMDGRYFDGRRVDAWVMEPGEQYKKTKRRDEEEMEDKRLEKLGNWLENDN